MTPQPTSARRLVLRGVALRGRFAVLFLLALLPAFLASLYTTFEQRQHLHAAASDTTKRIARLSAAYLERVLGSTYQVLALLDEDPSVLAGGASCEARFEHVLAAAAHHNFTAFAFADGDGTLICSSPKPSGRVRLSDALFRRLQAGEDFVIGEAEFGPITKKPVLVAVQAIRRNGRLAGFVAAGVDLERFSDLAERAQLPPGAILVLLNSDGEIMVRYPDPTQLIGRSIKDLPFFQEMKVNPEGTGMFEPASLDGVRRVWGWAALTVAGTQFFTSVGLSAEHVMAAADDVFYDNLRGFGVAAVVALVTAALAGEFFLRRPIERMRLTSERIAAGDLTARVGLDDAPGELGALSRAIDDMANGLQSREHRLATLSRRVLEVQEFERRALARELHDEIGQSLTALKLMLQRHRQVDECRETGAIDELLALADGTLQQVRGLSLDLRPPMLDHLGLAATLRWYVDRESERAGLVASCRVEPDRLRLDPHLETTIFRIAQEALTNVVRHARASTITVNLTANSREVELSIRDDGVGFDVDAANERARRGESLGLLGMEERAALAGGAFHIVSGPSGTEVRATFSGVRP